MKIIKIIANESGSRPPLQEWNWKTPPKGYAFCEDRFCDIFYSSSIGGFVNISVKDNKVVKMSINEAAIKEYESLVKGKESEVSEGNGS